jgi:hypothetical protein
MISKKVFLIGLAIFLVLTLGLLLWDRWLMAGMRPTEIPYLKFDREDRVSNVTFDGQGNAWVFGKPYNQQNGIFDQYFLKIIDENGALVKTYSSDNSPLMLDIRGQDRIGHFDDKSLIIFEDRQGREWFATGDTLYLLDGDIWITFPKESLDLGESRIDSIAGDLQNRMWLGLSYGGLAVIEGQTVLRYTAQNSILVSNAVSDIDVDKAGRIWIITWGGGINIVDGQEWQAFTQEGSPLLDNYIKTIAFDEQDRAWIGTSKGVNVFDGQNWLTYTTANSGLLDNYSSSIFFDKAGQAWIDNTVYDGMYWKHFIPDRSLLRLKERYIPKLYPDGKVRVEINTGGITNNVLQILEVPENIHLASKPAYDLHLFIFYGGLILFVYLIGLWIVFYMKAYWTGSISLAVTTIFGGLFAQYWLSQGFISHLLIYSNPGFVSAIFMLIGGILGRLIGKRKNSEGIGLIIGGSTGSIIGGCFMAVGLFALMGD